MVSPQKKKFKKNSDVDTLKENIYITEGKYK